VNKVGEVIVGRNFASPIACTGTYFFRKAKSFLSAAEAVVAQRNAPYSVSQCYNEMIASGETVEAVPVQKFWRVGSLDEIQKFTTESYHYFGPEKLTATYDEMQGRQARKIAEVPIL
jgi:dTDP-glucose pyrophosphorylase